MRTIVRIFVGIAAYGTFMINSVTAQERLQIESLDAVLRRSVSERIGGPLVFSTRDTLFALSLPTDEPATVYLQLTIGRNGKVKEKQTKVHANHVAQYVAPAFVEATKGLRIDRALLSGLGKKDTAVLVEFPMEYCHVLDTTINNTSQNKTHPYRSYNAEGYMWTSFYGDVKQLNRFFTPTEDHPYSLSSPYFPKPKSIDGYLNFYIAFIQDVQE